MSRRPMTELERQEVSLRFKNYWEGRRLAKEQALVAPKVEEAVTTPTVVGKKMGRPLGSKDKATRAKKASGNKMGRAAKNNVNITTKIETVVKKPYVFATVTVIKGDQVMSGHGFAKWDNVAPAWNEDFGKQIAIGRAKKQIKKEHGIVVK